MAAGRTLTSIAADWGVSPSTDSRAAKRAGITVPTRQPQQTAGSRCTELNDHEWLESNYATRPVADLAAELGVAVSTVYGSLRRRGITIREPATSRRRRRPAPLQDAGWLHARYEHATAKVIADELSVNAQMVYASMRQHGIEDRDRSAKQQFRSPAELDDADWLHQRFSEVSAPTIATQLGVTRRTVYLALERHDIDVARSPWVNHGHVRLTSPDEVTLRRLWQTEETIKGSARQLDVSVNTAAVWLADIGIFVRTPLQSHAAN